MNTQKLQLLKYLIENQQWIKPTHEALFNDNNSSKLYHLIRRIDEKGNPISFQALRHILQAKPEFLEYIDGIEGQPQLDKATATVIREELQQEARLRLLQELPQHDITDTKVYKALLKRINDLQLSEVPPELNKPVSFTEWDRHHIEEGNTVSSGLRFLKDTGSDTKVGDLLNFLAASNNFKSGAMAHIVKQQIASGRNVLFFSMEETANQFLNRIGHGLTKMTPHQYNQLSVREIEQNYEGQELGHLDVLSGQSIIVEELQDLITDLEEEKGYTYDFIVIDYSAQVTSNKINKSTQEHQIITHIFRELKMIALNAANPKIIVTAIQSNRDGYKKNKTPDLDNTAASMGGVHNADLMISLKYVPNPDAPQRETPADEEPDDIKGYVKFKISKKRTGTIKVGDWFIARHLANGNVSWEDTTQDNEEQWDNLFNGILETGGGYGI